jgi:hypothetical protein
VPSTSVPPSRACSAQPAEEEAKPKPRKPKEPTKAQLGKMAQAMKEEHQRVKRARKMETKMNRLLEDARTQEQQAAHATPSQPVLLR